MQKLLQTYIQLLPTNRHKKQNITDKDLNHKPITVGICHTPLHKRGRYKNLLLHILTERKDFIHSLN